MGLHVRVEQRAKEGENVRLRPRRFSVVMLLTYKWLKGYRPGGRMA